MSSDRRQFLRGQWLREFAQLPTPEGATEIASVVVYAMPNRLDAVRAAVRAIPGAEISAEDARGKLVVLVEAAAGAKLGQILTDLSTLPDVVSATLVYHAVALAEVTSGEVA